MNILSFLWILTGSRGLSGRSSLFLDESGGIYFCQLMMTRAFATLLFDPRRHILVRDE